jgi:DegV family protein with EDD domain
MARGLSELGYEVVPADGPEEGRRFAQGLGPGVIVTDAGVPGFGDASILDELRRATGASSRLLVLGDDPATGEELPDDVLFLAAGDLDDVERVRRIRLVLVGWELGVEPDSRLTSLVGELSLTPVLEVVRGMGRALVSGRLSLEGGEVVFARGEAIAASAGQARGIKAFCRLGGRLEGPFRIVLGRPGVEREIEPRLEDLVIRAIEDRVAEAPTLESRLEVNLGPSFFGTQFTPFQQSLLTAAQDGPSVGGLLDRFEETDGTVLRELARLRALDVVTLREPDARVRVITDSTGDLPADLAREHGIRVVPLLLRFGDRIFRDGVDISAGELYDRLEKESAHPVSNPPTPGELLQLYRDLAPGHDLVSVHISAKLSETAGNARRALEQGGGDLLARPNEAEPAVIEVVDSTQVSLGLGLLALFAARLARRHRGAAEIAERLRGMGGRVQVLFVVDTLEYLARGGRIGKARAWMGGLLGIKPILGVAEGEVVPVDRVRGGRAAHPRMLELFKARLDPSRPVLAAVAHAKAPVWADRLRALLEAELDVHECLVGEMGPVVGAHAGPGAVGAALYQPVDDEELELLAAIGG